MYIVVEVTLNWAEYGSGRASLRMSTLNQLYEDLKVIFFIETKCRIRFIYVGFNCKRKKGGKEMSRN